MLLKDDTEWSIILDKFPLPPTVNKAYFNARNRGRVKTKEMNAFLKAVNEWSLLNRKIIKHASNYLLNNMLEDELIKIDAWVCFDYTRLFTLKDIRKNIDVSNRIKPLHDAISSVLMVDDRYFSVGETKPVITEGIKSECIILRLSLEKIQLREDIIDLTTPQIEH